MGKPVVRTHELTKALRDHYLPPTEMLPGGIFATEVTGFRRRVDAVYVGFTAASGRIMVGHELKVSRADWLHELDSLGKSDEWADACHAWYVVAPSLDIVPKEEVPAGWGLMTPDPRARRRFKVHVRSAIKVEHNPPWWAVRAIMASQDTARSADSTRRIGQAAQATARAILDGALESHASATRVPYWREYFSQVHEAIRTYAQRMGGGGEDAESKEAREILEAFAAVGIDLCTTDWSPGPGLAVRPRDLAPLRDILGEANAHAQVRDRITRDWASVKEVAQQSARLLEMIATLDRDVRMSLDGEPQDAVR